MRRISFTAEDWAASPKRDLRGKAGVPVVMNHRINDSETIVNWCAELETVLEQRRGSERSTESANVAVFLAPEEMPMAGVISTIA